MDNRKRFFKSYVKRTCNQESKPGTSKTEDLRLNVVRKLTFQTPKKQKKSLIKSSSNISEKSDQKKEQFTSLIRDDISEEILNLSDESIESAQKVFTDEEKDSTIKRESEIFREIERRAEIEEACEQIRQEQEQFTQDMEEFNLETTNRSPNFDFDNGQEILTDITIKTEKNIPIDTDYKLPLNTLNENYTDNKSKHIINESEKARNEDKTQEIICLQNNLEKNDDDTLNLKCLENFQEMDFDFQEDIYSENISPTTKKPMNIKKGTKRRSVNENDQILYDTKTHKKNKTQEKPKDNQSLPENKNGTSSKEIKKIDEESSKQVDDIVNSAVLEGKACSSTPVCSDLNKNNEVAKCHSSKHEEHVTCKRLRQENRQKYVDFLSDNEDFVWSSSSWEETSESESSGSGVIKKKKNKKKKKGRADKNSETNCGTSVGVSKKKKQKNVRNEKKRKREAGEEYLTPKGKIMPAKNMKSNPCSLNNCTNKCYEVTEERRNSLFTHFWSLNNTRRRDWLVSHSKKLTVKRHRSLDINKRKNTFNYFINEGEGQRQVCQKFLTSTLDINQKTLYNTVVNSTQGSASEDMRGKHVPSNKTTDSVIESVRTYIQELPALPSHYCRKNSKRTYLPRDFRNLSNLYRIYKATQEENSLEYVGEKVFKKIFTTEYNIGFHLPRKDKCLKCTQYENGTNIDEQEKQRHLKDKEDTAKRFKAHQEIYNKDNSILCTTFDLQKVLNTPHGENMMLYYSRKLSVYNLTFYESGTRNGFCYTWSESDGKRGANEVSSILHKYIKEVDERRTIKHLLLYCDSCPGQNKNKTVLACINETLQNCNNLLSIQINYLLPGHTYMPVDSVHSVIEKSLSGVIIWAPSQWSTVFSLARKSPKPYEVEVQSYTNFNKWDAISDKYFQGNLMGKISKIRTATFKKSAPDSIVVKFFMDLDAKTERIEIIKKRDAIQLKPCYKTTLHISKKKYMDLNKLCTNKVIPTMYHEEYKKLHYNNNIQDCLADTDNEDEENAD